jgi:hypothetical protein
MTLSKAPLASNYICFDYACAVDKQNLCGITIADTFAVERCCQVQLLSEAAAANGVAKIYVSDEAAKYTFVSSSTPETLYWEAQPDMEYEEVMCGGAHRD